MRAWEQGFASESVIAAFYSGSKEVLPWPVAAPAS